MACRWLALLAAGAVTGVATAVGLLLSVYVGLFGYTESLSVPYATLSLAVEFTAAFVLLVATALLAFGRTRAMARHGSESRKPTRFGVPGSSRAPRALARAGAASALGTGR